MLVDYERAWLRLKAVIDEKRSHGQRDLHAAMAKLEVECMLDHDHEAVPTPSSTRATTDRPSRTDGMPGQTDPLAAEEASNGTRTDALGAAAP
jgi:hypothetical protein